MEKLAELPPEALVPFGIVLAIIFAVRYFGLLQGSKAPSNAQVAAVIVDSSALTRATAALEAHTTELINGRKSFERGTETVSRSVDRLTDEVDNLTKELIRPRR